MKLTIVVIGAGGHAAVVADALLSAGHTVLGFTDAALAPGTLRCGLPVLGPDQALAGYAPDQVWLANGLGMVDNQELPLRVRTQAALEAQGWRFCSVVHAAAVVSPFAVLGPGVQIMAGSVVQPHAAIGAGCIINTGALIDHDTLLGAQCHIAPGAILCGQVRLGARSHVGAGATIRQGVSLGPRTLVGAGAIVVRDFAGHGTLTGIPARPLN